MAYGRVFREIPEEVTVDDIVGIELSRTGGFFRTDPFDDRDFRRFVDLRSGTYVSRRRASKREASKELDADDVDAIRRIIADSGILDIELDTGKMLLDAGDYYITLITGTDRYTIDRRCSVGPSFSCFWDGVMEVVALEDPPEGEPSWDRTRSCEYRGPAGTVSRTVGTPAD